MTEELEGVLKIVYNNQNYWVCGLCSVRTMGKAHSPSYPE
jgi:hypothetical protein